MIKSPFFLLIVLLIISKYGNSQATIELPLKDSVINFEKVAEITDTGGDCKKDILYSKTKSWIAKLFNDANQVVKMDDKEGGRFVVKYLFQIERVTYMQRVESVYCNLTIQIDLRDCKYRIVVNEPILSSVLPLYAPNLSSTYVQFYSKNISPKQLRALFEGEKAWFLRYDMYYNKIKIESEGLILGFENFIKKDIKKDDW